MLGRVTDARLQPDAGPPAGADRPVHTEPLADWSGEHAARLDGPAPDASAEPESFVVRVDTGERIHYLDWGTPVGPIMPPLVLLHGIAQTCWSFAPIARRLCGLTSVVAPDLRGHGLSEAAAAGYDLDSLAADMLTVMAGKGWGETAGGPPAVVAGHGFGAMIAATMAVLQPASVAGVCLLDGGWEEVAEATRSSPAELLATMAEPPEVMSSLEAFLADREAFDPPTWDADQERAARSQVDARFAGHVALVSRARALRAAVDSMFDYQPLQALGSAAALLSMLVAEAATPDDEAEHERRLALADVVRVRAASGLTAPRVVRLTGSAHNLMRYRPAEVAAELLGLLEIAALTSDRMPGAPR